MHFTVVSMQMNGDIKDRRRYSWADLQRRELNRQLTDAFAKILDNKLPATVSQTARFRDGLGDSGWELDWQQPDDVSAVFTLFLAGRPVATCLLLSGFDPARDAAAVSASEDLLAAWRAKPGWPAGPGVRAVRDRPLAVAIPWPLPVADSELRRAGLWSLSLAAAFFRRAAAAAADPGQN